MPWRIIRKAERLGGKIVGIPVHNMGIDRRTASAIEKLELRMRLPHGVPETLRESAKRRELEFGITPSGAGTHTLTFVARGQDTLVNLYTALVLRNRT